MNDNIFLLTGELSSKIYKLDFNFKIIPVSHSCNIDELILPTEWKVADTMEIDYVTGIIYIFYVKEPFNGFAIVNIKNMELSGDFHQFIFYRDNSEWTPNYLNTTFLSRKTGKIFVANRAEAESFFYAISEIKLLGCAEGRRKDFNKCSILV